MLCSQRPLNFLAPPPRWASEGRRRPFPDATVWTSASLGLGFPICPVGRCVSSLPGGVERRQVVPLTTGSGSGMRAFSLGRWFPEPQLPSL